MRNSLLILLLLLSLDLGAQTVYYSNNTDTTFELYRFGDITTQVTLFPYTGPTTIQLPFAPGGTANQVLQLQPVDNSLQPNGTVLSEDGFPGFDYSLVESDTTLTIAPTSSGYSVSVTYPNSGSGNTNNNSGGTSTNSTSGNSNTSSSGNSGTSSGISGNGNGINGNGSSGSGRNARSGNTGLGSSTNNTTPDFYTAPVIKKKIPGAVGVKVHFTPPKTNAYNPFDAPEAPAPIKIAPPKPAGTNSAAVEVVPEKAKPDYILWLAILAIVGVIGFVFYRKSQTPVKLK